MTLQIAVLIPSYLNSTSVLCDVEAPKDPALFDRTKSRNYHHIFLSKATSAQTLLRLKIEQKYDMYLNLCDGDWFHDVPGVEVVETLEKLQLPYTGADPIFYSITKQSMKLTAVSCNVPIPNHFFIYDQSKLNEILKNHSDLKTPMIVKSYNDHNSVGLDEKSLVNNFEDLTGQIEKMILEFGGALVEEFIDGPEFTTLVVQNANDSDNPFVFEPVLVEFLISNSSPSFKCFDAKWKNSSTSFRCKPVVDLELAKRLKEMTSMIFLISNGTGYARCDFRMDKKTEKIYFLEINANCSVFYRGEFGSADEILQFDQLNGGHDRFLSMILDAAVVNHKKRIPKIDLSYHLNKGFFGQAIQDFQPGDIIKCQEMGAQFLMTRRYLERRWLKKSSHKSLKLDLMRKYAYQLSPNVYYAWDENPNKWIPYNHSCDPNAWLDGFDVVARKSIKTGQEICLDYATFAILDDDDSDVKNDQSDTTTHGSLFESNEFSCSCGESICRQIVKPSTDYKHSWFQNRYGEHVSDYVKMKLRQFNDKRK